MYNHDYISGHYYPLDQNIIPDQTTHSNLAELPDGHHSTPLVVGKNDHIVHPVKQLQTRAKQKMEEPQTAARY